MTETVPIRPVPDTALARAARRLVTIPGYALAALGLLALSPLAVPLLALADALLHSRGARLRLWLFALVYLGYELLGLAAAFALWLAALASPRLRGAGALAAHLRLQRWWATSLFRAAARIFRLTLSVEGADAALGAGPFVVLIRHVSLADTLLPAVVLDQRLQLRLRYVLKRELLLDPCLDVVGQRLHTAFVRRGSGESAPEIAAISALAEGLGPGEGVLIYPEGTRFTRAKAERALGRIAASDRPELLARAQRLRAVLPPRTAGALALLAAAPTADVLVFAHTGLEGLATLRDVWRGGMVGRRILVRLWRVPRAAIPSESSARALWLFDEWARLDAWVVRAAAEGTA